MTDEIKSRLVNDVENVIDKWIEDSIYWARAIEETGSSDFSPYEEILPDLDYICQKLVPSSIERVKFLNSHTHDFDVHENCIHCNIWIGDVSANG